MHGRRQKINMTTQESLSSPDSGPLPREEDIVTALQRTSTVATTPNHAPKKRRRTVNQNIVNHWQGGDVAVLPALATRGIIWNSSSRKSSCYHSSLIYIP
nr:PREDICTED: uncharacterized protein LOC105663289 isoform X3 [Megachile rotundata]